MRHPSTLGALALAVLCLLGCSGPRGSQSTEQALALDEAQSLADTRFRAEPFSDQVRQGVLRQRALFDHHFVPETARLTRLGERDLGILAEGLRESGGRIALPRGSESAELHAARIATVSAALQSRGITPEQLAPASGPASGAGVASVDALTIRSRIATAPMPQLSNSAQTSGTSTTPTRNLQ